MAGIDNTTYEDVAGYSTITESKSARGGPQGENAYYNVADPSRSVRPPQAEDIELHNISSRQIASTEAATHPNRKQARKTCKHDVGIFLGILVTILLAVAVYLVISNISLKNDVENMK